MEKVIQSYSRSNGSNDNRLWFDNDDSNHGLVIWSWWYGGMVNRF